MTAVVLLLYWKLFQPVNSTQEVTQLITTRDARRAFWEMEEHVWFN